MLLHFVDGDLLLAIGADGHLYTAATSGGCGCAGNVVAADFHRAGDALGFCLGELLALLGFSALTSAGEFFIFIVGFGFHFDVHGTFFGGVLVLGGWVVLVVGWIGGGQGFFDTKLVSMEGHHGFLFEGGVLEVGEGSGRREVGGVVSFGEDDGFDNDKVVPVELGISH